MPTIDSDAHVIETDRTWGYMTGADAEYRPQTVLRPTATGAEEPMWLVDGNLRPRTNVGKDTSEEAREMADIEKRLKHMDELEVDIQVLYPTMFLTALTRRPHVEVAMCKGYNRWLADIWAVSKDRLRWAAVLPLLDMPTALGELEFCRQHGACAVFMRGIEGVHTLDAPYFYPLYDAASEVNMPLGIHAGVGNLDVNAIFTDPWMKNKLCTIGAFQALINAGIPARLPKLRIGFIETSAQWVPYALHDLAKRRRRSGGIDMNSVLRDNRIYVACQPDDDLPYVLRYAGEDNLVLGTDYGHNDTATEIDALRHLKRDEGMSAAAINRILDDNARALYGL
jgi:predicted TIM-barrel fold metal-dependent hydrolase